MAEKNILKNGIKNLLNKLPYIKNLKKELDIYKTKHVPPGHFYSPIHSINETLQREDQIFNIPTFINDEVDYNQNNQASLIHELKKYYEDIPFPEEKNDEFRYYYNNSYFVAPDAITLHGLIRHYNPKKIIEIGSGYSSAVILDTNDRFMDEGLECTFIEPNTERLKSLLRNNDSKKATIIEKCVQDVDIEYFRQLKGGDIFFVDSSHVSKVGSDVNYIMFNILPALQKGVLIHFHDIFYPFEYPKEWVITLGRSYNEAYILRAFLQYNSNFEILLFNDQLAKVHKPWLKENMPLFLKELAGSFWMRKK